MLVRRRKYQYGRKNSIDSKRDVRISVVIADEKTSGSNATCIRRTEREKMYSCQRRMLSFEKDYGKKFKKYIVVCNKEEYEQLQGGSYLAHAIKQYKIELILLELDKDHKKQLRKAMKEQDLRGK